MTVMQLRLILAQLPFECQQWPVTVQYQGEDRPMTAVVASPPGYAEHDYPLGCVHLWHYCAPTAPDPAIRIYRPAPGRRSSPAEGGTQ